MFEGPHKNVSRATLWLSKSLIWTETLAKVGAMECGLLEGC